MADLLEALDSALPQSLTKFDAFPKLPSSYKARTSSGGLISVVVSLLALLLMLNDIGEYIWGWPDSEFAMDDNRSFMKINVDVVVAMPCRYVSIDLRDAIGDRLMLSGGLRRDGTKFDVTQATALKEHARMLSAKQAVAQSRQSRGFFGNLFTGRSGDGFKPTYNNVPHGSACRVWGQVEAKKVTANLHITTLGHGYAAEEHVDHKNMNLSHVINEFSFGPHFPDITQPLDNSFELTHDPFIAYQYFIHVVPTEYIAPRTAPLDTNQYSVTHYTRKLEHGRGTPGIFFKFDVDPIKITIWQRTTGIATLLMRCVGVLGGVFVCMGYAVRVTSKTIEAVAGPSEEAIAPTASSSGAKVGLRAKWGGTSLRSRPKSGRLVPQGSGWVMEGSPGSPYTPTYSGTPTSGTFRSPSYSATPTSGMFPPSSPFPGSPGFPPATPHLQSAMNTNLPPSVPATPNPSAGLGFSGFPTSPPTSAARQGSYIGHGPPPHSPSPQQHSHQRTMSNSGHFPPPPRSPLPPQRVSSAEGGKKDD